MHLSWNTLINWLGFNGTFSTNRQYHAFEKYVAFLTVLKAVMGICKIKPLQLNNKYNKLTLIWSILTTLGQETRWPLYILPIPCTTWGSYYHTLHSIVFDAKLAVGVPLVKYWNNYTICSLTPYATDRTSMLLVCKKSHSCFSIMYNSLKEKWISKHAMQTSQNVEL